LPPPGAPKLMGIGGVQKAVHSLLWFLQPPEMITIPGLTTSGWVEAAAPRPMRALQPVQQIENQIKARDRMITIVTGVIAVLLGVFLLWIDNMTWGSTKDMFVAILWGLGLHQIAGNAAFATLDLGNLESQLVSGKAQGGSSGQH
jgi:hypothetical protein